MQNMCPTYVAHVSHVQIKKSNSQLQAMLEFHQHLCKWSFTGTTQLHMTTWYDLHSEAPNLRQKSLANDKQLLFSQW